MVGLRASLASALKRTPPLRLAAWAGGAAVLAIALFAAVAGLRDDGPESGVRAVDPSTVGLQDLAVGPQGVLDTDLDGVPDAFEALVLGSDPQRWNSSGTPVPDGWLASHGYDPRDPAIALRPAAIPPASALPPAYGNRWPDEFQPTLAEVYSWNRPLNWTEREDGPYDNGLDPRQWDNNDDGIPDGWLMHYDLDPLEDRIGERRLAGANGLTVAEAFQHDTDPTALDGDRDGLLDRDEVDGPSNGLPGGSPARFAPTDPGRYDSAGTGVCDGYLVAHGLDPNDPRSSYADADNDGASTREEFLWSVGAGKAGACTGQGLDPRKLSTSGLGLFDGWLLGHGLDALDPDIGNRTTQSSATDPQPDGLAPARLLRLTVRGEYEANRPQHWDESRDGPWLGGSDPSLNDTDGDGLGDAWELAGYSLVVATEPGEGFGPNYTTVLDPLTADSDGDGSPDGEEAKAGTDGRRADTDFDGLSDGEEATIDPGLKRNMADSTAFNGQGDGLRDGERYLMLLNRSATYGRGDLTYEYPGQPGVLRSVNHWVCAPVMLDRPVPSACGSGDGETLPELPASVVSALFAPGSDADGDGATNILDSDIDNDDLENGLELRPSTYETSPQFSNRTPNARRATDPLNPDTDGDTLPDRWEVDNGLPVAGGYNLDPAVWDSDGVLPHDGEADPDDDGLVAHSFDDGSHVVFVIPFTNRLEYESSTDPNEPDGDGDDLLDGWEAFWGLIYTGERNGLLVAPDPHTAQTIDDLSSLLFTETYQRIALTATDVLGPGDTPLLGVVEAAGPSSGGYVRITGDVDFRMHDAQALQTNPYERDTDGDGAPDWWEALHGSTLPGTPEDAACSAEQGPDPLAIDAGADPDDDGLPNADEFLVGGDPLCADSDAGGVWDGEEAERRTLLLDAADDDEVGTADTDNDGLPDSTELRGVEYGGLGRVRTDPFNPDTDGDGLLDGPDRPLPCGDDIARRFFDLGVAHLPAGATCKFIGERSAELFLNGNPLETFDFETGIPAGWLVVHEKAPHVSSRVYAEHYRVGRPAWWSEPIHGPWWGGADPLQSLPTLSDMDGDLLSDLDEVGGGFEDEFPGANKENRLRTIPDLGREPLPEDPVDEGLDLEERRFAAQSFVNPPAYAYPQHQVPHGTVSETRPSKSCLRDPVVEGSSVQAGVPVLAKGVPGVVRGRLTVCNSQTALPGYAIEARMGEPGHLFGIGVTDAQGNFEFPVDVSTANRSFGILPSHGLQTALLGVKQGTPDWAPEASVVPTGEGLLFVRSYGNADRQGDVAALAVRVRAGSILTLALPESVPDDGKPVPLRLELKDSGGAPLDRPIKLKWDNVDVPGVATVGGVYDRPLPAPSHSGLVELRAEFDSTDPDIADALAVDGLYVRRTAFLNVSAPANSDAGMVVHVTGMFATTQGLAGLRDAVVDITLEHQGVVLASTVAVTRSSSPVGRYEADLALPAELLPGNYTVSAFTNGTDEASAARGQDLIAVRSLPSFRAVRTTDLTAGAGHLIEATLAEPDGRAIVNATVRVELGPHRVETRTLDEGKLRLILNGSLPPGTALQGLSFGGDAAHAPADHTVERSVLSRTTLTLEGGRLARGGPVALPLRLTDNNSAPIAGAAIAVTWGNETPVTVLTNATGHATFQRPGHAADPLGAVTVRARYAGSLGNALAPAQATAVATLQALAELRLPGPYVDGGSPPPTARLVDAGTGEPLAGRAITVRLDNGTPVATTTDAGGRFPLMDSQPATVEPTARHVEVTFAGDGQYPATRAALHMLVRSPVDVHVSLPGLVVSAQPALVPAEVTDARGLPAQGGVLEARLGERLVGAALVRGGPIRLNVTLPLDAPAGAATLAFSYLGSDTHGAGSSDAATRVLSKATLVATAEPVEVGEMAALTVQLLVGGQPRPDESLTLQLEGAAAGIVAVTDGDGVAHFEVPQTGEGLRFLVRYGGDGAASPASAAGDLVPLVPPTILQRGLALLPWVTVAAALLLGGAAIAARVLGRHPLAPAFSMARRALLARGGPAGRILLAYRALEDAAIGLGALQRPATTPRQLQVALAARLPLGAHAPLERLIGLFEEARYSLNTVTVEDCDAALSALREMQRALARAPRAMRPAAGVPS
ncbi:MAG: DUF4129 domain-containing protein [Thermoplasmatota archaeon]